MAAPKQMEINNIGLPTDDGHVFPINRFQVFSVIYVTM